MNTRNQNNILATYKKHLAENGVLDEETAQSVLCARRFLEFTKGKNGNPVRPFIEKFGASPTDRLQLTQRLWTFLVFNKMEGEASDVFKMLDGYDIPDTLKTLLEEEGCSAEISASVFSSAKPAIHAEEKEKSDYIIGIHENLRAKAGAETYRDVLHYLHHGMGKKAVNRKRWGKVTKGNIKKYIDDLKKMRLKEYIDFILGYRKDNLDEADLKILLDKAAALFTIEYDEKSGAIIFDKWPYNPAAYFSEEDPVKKRYHLCHCPWARYAILEHNSIPLEFCICSAGFTRRNFLGDIEGELTYEILETVLHGDNRCRFVFHVPPALR